MRVFKTPWLVQTLLPNLTWRHPTKEKIIYLTFDDGPIPGITEFVLKELQLYQAKATFFCVGQNIRKYPEIAHLVAEAGHSLGNHTFHHLKGWETPVPTYINNIQLCQQELDYFLPLKKNKLFRPPYGRLTPQQYRLLTKDYQIVMWDVLTYDFDKNLPRDICLQQAIKNTKPGSIVVFHDSLKAWHHLQYTLPRYLAYFSDLDYRFEAL